MGHAEEGVQCVGGGGEAEQKQSFVRLNNLNNGKLCLRIRLKI